MSNFPLWRSLNDHDRKESLLRLGYNEQEAIEWLDDPNAMPLLMKKKLESIAKDILAEQDNKRP